MAGGVDVEDEAQTSSRAGSGVLGGRPPGWLFHGLLAAAAVTLLWADSVPGSMRGWELVGWFVWFWFAVTWLVWLVLYVGVPPRLSWWFLVAPLMFVVLVSMLVAHVPLKARWAGSRDAFDAALARIPIGPGSMFQPIDETVGSYRIVAWRQFFTSTTSSSDTSARYGVAFIEENPARSSWDSRDEAGFAYLPEGPGERFMWTVALGDGWYAWREDRVAMGGQTLLGLRVTANGDWAVNAGSTDEGTTTDDYVAALRGARPSVDATVRASFEADVRDLARF